MIRQLIRSRRKQVIVDINTQKDFFLADGLACIRNHRRVLAHIRRVVAWARREHLPIISMCEIYPNDNGASFPRYCLDGTEGMEKIHYTLLGSRVIYPADSHSDFPLDILRQYQQIIMHKRCVDPFKEPRIERLMSEVRFNEFILVGALAESSVLATGLGLLQRGKKVTVISDAVGWHDKREAKLANRKMAAKGAKVIETKKLAGTSHLQQVGVCPCPSCQGITRKVSIKPGLIN